jgi:hypothetical protein
MKIKKYTITGKDADLILVTVFGSENLKTVSGIVRKAEKFISSICEDFDLYSLYLKNVYYVTITDNVTDRVIYKNKLSDIIDNSNGSILLEKSLIEKYKFIEEDPHYYLYIPEILNKKCFLELRSYNISLNEICLKIEKTINEYNIKKAA